MDLVRLAQHVGLQWPPTGRGRKQDDERTQHILELWLACKSLRAIGEAVMLSAEAVRNIVRQLSENFPKVDAPDSLQLDTLWEFSHNAAYGMDYPGRIPGQIVENLLYLYTQPFETVVDPMHTYRHR